MALIRVFEDREYLPEYSTLMIRDTGRRGPARVRVDDLLSELAVDTQPCSIARAGDGWIDGGAGDGYQEVRLELHDAPPPPESDDWSDVVETPFATGGTVGLCMATGGEEEQDPFRLGEPGLYRLRFCRRPAADGDRYLLQFWPVTAPPQPPRWIARSSPLLPEDDWQHQYRFEYAVSDLVSLLLWTREAGVDVTVDGLADRLLCTPDAVRTILTCGVKRGVLAPFDDTDGPLALTVQPRPEPPSQQVTWTFRGAPKLLQLTGSAMVDSAETVASVDTPSPDRAEPGAPPEVSNRHASIEMTWAWGHSQSSSSPAVPYGAPPKAGIVGNGNLVVWRDDRPVVLAQWPGVGIEQALQSRHGTVLLTLTQAVLVRPDGEFVLLGTNMGATAALDAAGERLGIVESHFGRRSWDRLHLIDLADGSRNSMPCDEMPWDETASIRVVGILGGAVYVNVRARNNTSAPDELSVRWIPGERPQVLPYQLRQVDPYGGVILAESHEHEALLIDADGGVTPVRNDPLDILVPGGRYLCQWQYMPPGLHLYDLLDTDRVRTFVLPARSQTVLLPVCRAPVWEDPDHVLVSADGDRNALDVPVVRLHVGTGAIERINLPPEAGCHPVLVTPLWEQAERKSRSTSGAA